jgi:hypothetical protein
MDGPSQSLSSRSIWLRSQNPRYAPSTEASESLALVLSSSAAAMSPARPGEHEKQSNQPTDVRNRPAGVK